jgi:hypothetical protein
MPFGQPTGPPASARQVRDLLALLQDAGHVDFRDARGPMGFTQRQAAGKFTRDEAEAFVEQLQREADEGPPGEGDGPPDDARAAEPSKSQARPSRTPGRPSAAEQALRRVPAEQLAAELQRRGWVVMEP